MDLIDVINLNNKCSSNIHIQADMAPIKKFNPLPNKIININISTSVSFIQVYIKHVMVLSHYNVLANLWQRLKTLIKKTAGKR